MLSIIIIILDISGVYNKKVIENLKRLSYKNPIIIEGIVSEYPQEEPTKLKFVLTTKKIDNLSIKTKLSVIYFSRFDYIQRGDNIILYGKITQPKSIHNPGMLDYSKYLYYQGIYSTVFTTSVVKINYNNKISFISLASWFRKDIIDTIKKFTPSEKAQILLPMIIGDKSLLSYDNIKTFRDSGVMHILVVSGLNVGYIATLFWIIFRVFGFSFKLASFLSLPFLIIYMLITGANPPVVRATIMYISVILSIVLKRNPDIYQSMGLALLIILVFNPQSLFTASLQLSFAATFGIIYLYPYFIRLFFSLSPIFRYSLGSLFSVSFAAYIFVMPIIAYYFNKISLVGIISNLIIVPLSGVITAVGFCLYLFHFFSQTLTYWIAGLNNVLIHILIILVKFFSRLPFSTLTISSPTLILIIGYYILLFGFFCIFDKNICNNNNEQIKENVSKTSKYYIFKKRYAVILVIIGVIIIIISLGNQLFKTNSNPYITFLDAGNCDVVHISFKSGQDWLILCGLRLESRIKTIRRIIIPYFIKKGIHKIEKVFIIQTEPDIIKEILKEISIKEVLFPQECKDMFSFFKENNTFRNVIYKRLKQEDIYYINSTTTTIIPIENSLIFFLKYNSNRIILSPGLYYRIAKQLISSGMDLKTDCLYISGYTNRKIPKDFINETSAKDIIISGKKHRILKLRLGDDKLNVYYLTESGAVTIVLLELKYIPYISKCVT